MKNLGLFALIIGSILFVNITQAYSQTAEVDLSKINLEKFKVKFAGKFCFANKESPYCKKRWKNFSELVSFIKSDSRVKNPNIAAFMMTTAAVETGCVNFAPTVEGCGRLDPEEMERKQLKLPKDKRVEYWIKDKDSKKAYYGRGWLQLTWKDNYEKATKAIGQDFVNNPELALEPKNAYEILYLALTEGWLEFYRGTSPGIALLKNSIKITDFIMESGEFDYLQARAIINAKCTVKCKELVNGKNVWKKDIMRRIKDDKYLPYPEHLDGLKRMNDFPFFLSTILESIN